jgi:hypothetical protein
MCTNRSCGLCRCGPTWTGSSSLSGKAPTPALLDIELDVELING